MSPAARLAALKGQRAAIDAEINLIEAGISRAAYDASLCWQLSCVNDERETKGLRKLTLSQFLAAADADVE